MKGKKMFIYALLTAILSIFVTAVTWPTQGFIVNSSTPLTYITFAGWATYFLFGASPKPAFSAYLCILMGIIGGAFMLFLSYVIPVPATWAVALGVGIAVFPMCYIAHIPFANNVAASFVGAALFFSLIAAGAFPSMPMAPAFIDYVKVGIAELYYVFIGFIAGYITIEISNFCSKMKD